MDAECRAQLRGLAITLERTIRLLESGMHDVPIEVSTHLQDARRDMIAIANVLTPQPASVRDEM